MDDKRQYELPLGELIDKLTILQLREMLLNTYKYAKEIQQLEHDIDLVMKKKNVVLTARTMRIIFLMGQLNTLIWMFKDKMEENDEQYAKYLKLAHQVNGLKNALKNKLMEETETVSSSLFRTNIKTDKLEYSISI